MLWNAKKWYSGTLVVLLVTMLAACGGGSNYSAPKGATLTRMSVSPATASLPLGMTSQLTVTGTYSDGTTRNLTTSATYTVSPSNVAQVSSAGVLKTTAQGNATVSATVTAITGQASVTVQAAAVSSMAISPNSPSIPLGTSQQMTATATYTDGTTGDVTDSAVWSVNPPQDLTVSGTGMIRGAAKGNFTLTATVGSVSNSISGSVVNAIVQSLQVNPNSAAIPLGTTQSFKASAQYSDGTSQDVTASTTWISSNPGIVSIDPSGVATASLQGTTQIGATYQTFTGAAALSVSAATVATIHLSPATATLAKGTSLQFSANATLSDGSSQDITNSVNWSSNSSSVCTVTSAALVTAAGVGSCTVTATSNSVHGSASLTISAATLSSIAITPPNPSVNSGGSLQLTATGTFSDGTTQNLSSSLTYVSSKPLVANVNASGLLVGLAPGTATITASLGAVSTAFTVTITSATLQGINIGVGPISIAAGLSVQLAATGSYSDGSTQDLTSTVSWTSSASVVATVNATGQVSGLGVGSATITATLGAVSGTTDLSVTSATVVSISVNPVSVTIAAGQSQSFTALAQLSDGTSVDVTASAHWSISNPLLATISNTLGTTGLMTSLIPGSGTVSASFDSVTGSANLYVSAASLVGISVSPSGLSLALGVPAILTATGSFSDGSTQDITASVQWSSSNGQFVSVAAGLVTPISIGSSTITASMNGINQSVGVSVTAAVLNSISISSTVNALALGLSQQLVATGTYSDSTTQNITAVVHWSSSNTAIATVSAGGLILAVGPGNANVSASLGSISQGAAITVNAASLVSIAVTATQTSFALGYSLQLKATGTYSDNSTQDLSATVNWSSNNVAVALIGSTGLLSGVSAGNLTATASLQGISGSLSVTVNSATLVSISISPGTISLLNLLATQQFTLTGHFSDGSTQVLSAGVHWSVTNSLLGAINSTGLLTALGLGNMNAVATYGGFTASATVTIL